MAMVEFDFQMQNTWNMGPACESGQKISFNPAPNTSPCIYIIHNSTENTTYVGYADNALDRWKHRTEVFHIMGITKSYAKKIMCAWCVPTVSDGKSLYLQGQNNCEHLLIRAVVNGLLGKTTSTNSQLRTQPFYNPIVTKVRVYLPLEHWGKLEGRKEMEI